MFIKKKITPPPPNSHSKRSKFKKAREQHEPSVLSPNLQTKTIRGSADALFTHFCVWLYSTHFYCTDERHYTTQERIESRNRTQAKKNSLSTLFRFSSHNTTQHTHHFTECPSVRAAASASAIAMEMPNSLAVSISYVPAASRSTPKVSALAVRSLVKQSPSNPLLFRKSSPSACRST